MRPGRKSSSAADADVISLPAMNSALAIRDDEGVMCPREHACRCLVVCRRAARPPWTPVMALSIDASSRMLPSSRMCHACFARSFHASARGAMMGGDEVEVEVDDDDEATAACSRPVRLRSSGGLLWPAFVALSRRPLTPRGALPALSAPPAPTGAIQLNSQET